MIKIRLLLCLLLTILVLFKTFAQSIAIEGKVIDTKTHQPVPFATLGIKGKSFGTITDESGKFHFNMQEGLVIADERLIISSVGYQSSFFSISQFKNGKQTIDLTPSSITLKAVTVKPLKSKAKVYGRTGNSTLMVTTMFTQKQLIDDYLGKEQAVILNIDPNCYLRDFNMYVAFNRFKNVKFRLNLYSVKNGYPDSLISDHNIIFDVQQKQGWVKVDLTPYDIYLTNYHKIAVAIQWLKSEKLDSSSHSFSVSATLSPAHSVFFRDKSQADWKKVGGAYVAFNLNADYFKTANNNDKEGVEDKDEKAELSDSLKNLLNYEKYREQAEASPYGHDAAAGKYIHLSNATLYYEVYGKGEPLLLLHGNSQSISAFYQQIAEFAGHYRVIAVDTRAQGKSTDSLDHDLTYELFARDMKQLMDSLDIKKANVVGWSDGGITALIMAMKYPASVNKLAIMGANLFPEGIEAKMLTGLQKEYEKSGKYVGPESVIRKRLLKILLTEPHIGFEQLKLIKAPVLVMAGEHDVILPEHTKDIAKHISNSKLLIFRNATHYAPQEKPQEFNKAVLEFLKK